MDPPYSYIQGGFWQMDVSGNEEKFAGSIRRDKKCVWVLRSAVIAALFCCFFLPSHAQTTQSRLHPAHHHASRTIHHHSQVRHPVVRRSRRHILTARELARSRRLHTAFIASAQLRPMAQQLVQQRTPEAYAAVLTWARRHSGEAAATAYLALGHAHLLDGDDQKALEDLHQAALHDHLLADYIAYLTAQAEIGCKMYPQAAELLRGFAARYPESLLRSRITLLRARIYLDENDADDALRVLHAAAADAQPDPAAYWLVLAQAEDMAGNEASADADYEHLFSEYPASMQAQQAHD